MIGEMLARIIWGVVVATLWGMAALMLLGLVEMIRSTWKHFRVSPRSRGARHNSMR